jgi:hypothetical protein
MSNWNGWSKMFQFQYQWHFIVLEAGKGHYLEIHAMHGMEGVEVLLLGLKPVTSRWPTGIRKGAEFIIPTMK